MPLTSVKCYDVKEFGALCDGSNDSVGIQAALNAITTDYLTSVVDASAGIGVFVRSQPVLYFPPGIYNIGTTISFNDVTSSMTVLGDDAILQPLSTLGNNWAFDVPNGYKFRLKGMSFLKFQKGVNVSNIVNLDTNQTVVQECAFQACGLALQIATHTSVVEKCKFMKNTKSVILGGEKPVFRENWITAGTMTGNYPCQVENYGFLEFTSNCLVPSYLGSPAVEAAWINNYRSIVVENTRSSNDEGGNYTLINNFAGNGGAYDPESMNSVIVKSSISFTAAEITGGGYQPSILRYVTKVPNLTLIEGNMSTLYGRMIGFSTHEEETIAQRLANSGPSTPAEVCISVVNNSGGELQANGSHVPQELFPFVRSNESKWPADTSNTLKILDTVPFDDGINPPSVTYKFEYPGTMISSTLLLERTQFMINYSGNPNPGGFVGYGGLCVGFMKAIGFYNGSSTLYRLFFEPVVNQKSVPGAVHPDPGPFTVTLYWDDPASTGTPGDLSVGSTNRHFYIKIEGRKGATAEYDRISVLPLFSF